MQKGLEGLLKLQPFMLRQAQHERLSHGFVDYAVHPELVEG